MANPRGSADPTALWISAVALGIALFAAGSAGVAVTASSPESTASAVDPPGTTVTQRVFASADEAVAGLVDANRADDLGALTQILGPAGAKLIRSGDAVADRNHRQRFVAAYDAAHRIEFDGPDRATLVVGAEEWPLPIPLVRGQSGWQFDTVAGRQEILDRRIGRNEFRVIKICRTYVQAQREYSALMASSNGQPEFAQHFMSRPGQHDGLYWPTNADEKESPLGPLVAQARTRGYGGDRSAGKPQPYYGYYFRILTRQGAHANGGAMDYIVDGHMTRGFALLAYPAVYGNSGVMTFFVNQDGIVFERNLGPHTGTIASRIEEYDPDRNWSAP